MRTYGALNPTDLIPTPPDTVGAAIISSAGAVVAQDWPSTEAHLIAFGSTMDFWANMASTDVNIPTTNSNGTTLSSGLNEYLRPGTIYQRIADSTGYSLTAPTSGVISLSFWRK
jgi:hypothetical protein